MTTRAYPEINKLRTMLELRKEINTKRAEAASLGFFKRSRKAALEREIAELQERMESTRQQILDLSYPYDHPIMMAARDMDAIPFGRLTEEESADMAPIQWKLLAIDDTKGLFLSRDALFSHTFHSFCEDVTYEDSTIRDILNDSCLNLWFDPGEKERIEEQMIWTNENSRPGKSPACTMDYLFLLDGEEAVKYLVPGGLSCQGIDLLEEGVMGADANVKWWLRSPGLDLAHRQYVDMDGLIDIDGTTVDMTKRGMGSFANDTHSDIYVRPAMWVQLV